MEPKNFTRAQGEPSQHAAQQSAFKEFDATELYCPRCRQAVPVRKHLLLVLSEGDKYEYRCVYCSESVGTKMDRHEKQISLIV